MTSIADEINRIRATKPKYKSEYKCDKCKDVKVIMVKDSQTGKMVARDCECAAKANALRYMRMSGISESDLNKTLSDFKTFDETELKRAKNLVFTYTSRFRGKNGDECNSLLLSGKPGTGKTMLGITAMNTLLRDSITCVYVSYVDLLPRLKTNRFGSEEQRLLYEKEMDRLKNIQVLFIDDLFKNTCTSADVELIHNILNYRYQYGKKPIIISTEKTPDELIKIDEALGSRIVEMCKGYTVTFKNAQNYRLR